MHFVAPLTQLAYQSRLLPLVDVFHDVLINARVHMYAWNRIGYVRPRKTMFCLVIIPKFLTRSVVNTLLPCTRDNVTSGSGSGNRSTFANVESIFLSLDPNRRRSAVQTVWKTLLNSVFNDTYATGRVVRSCDGESCPRSSSWSKPTAWM